MGHVEGHRIRMTVTRRKCTPPMTWPLYPWERRDLNAPSSGYYPEPADDAFDDTDDDDPFDGYTCSYSDWPDDE